MKIEKFDKKTRILDATITPKASNPRNADQIKTSICSVEDKADKISSYNRFVYDEEDAEGITVDRSSGVGPDIYLFDDEE